MALNINRYGLRTQYLTMILVPSPAVQYKQIKPLNQESSKNAKREKRRERERERERERVKYNTFFGFRDRHKI